MLISGHFVWRETPLNSRFSRIKAQNIATKVSKYAYTKKHNRRYFSFSCDLQKKLRLRSCRSHKITSITLIAATETNWGCTHTIYTQSKNYAYTHVTHSTYKPISPPTIVLKPYKTKRFYGKIARFSIVFIHKQQPNKTRAMPYIVRNHTKITRENTHQKHIQIPKLHRKTYRFRAIHSKS